jgi:cytochrome c biogenesis protein CcdA
VIILLLISLVLMPVGIVLILMGMWERKSDAPSVSGGSLKQSLVPFWKQRSWFETSQGYRSYVWGSFLLGASFSLNFLFFLTKLIQEGWR